VIAFLGAGSVVFTRELLADILSFPELRDVTLFLHDIDSERLATAEAIARRTAEQLGVTPHRHDESGPPGRTGRRGFRHQRHPGGHACRDRARLHHPGEIRAAPDDRRPISTPSPRI
jgi:hypothetical protein